MAIIKVRTYIVRESDKFTATTKIWLFGMLIRKESKVFLPALDNKVKWKQVKIELPKKNEILVVSIPDVTPGEADLFIKYFNQAIKIARKKGAYIFITRNIKVKKIEINKEVKK